jgi:hypothetical protein
VARGGFRALPDQIGEDREFGILEELVGAIGALCNGSHAGRCPVGSLLAVVGRRKSGDGRILGVAHEMAHVPRC